MKQEYKIWIKQNVTETYGKCAKITKEMQKVFPELSRIRGHYICPIWGEREHWWLIDKYENIIDPTRGQFPSLGYGTYKPWNEGDPEPTGKCPNCGGYCYNGDSVCSKECKVEYLAYLNNF